MKKSNPIKISLIFAVSVGLIFLYQTVPKTKDATNYDRIINKLSLGTELKLSKTWLVENPSNLASIFVSDSLIKCLKNVTGKGSSRGKYHYYLILNENSDVLAFAGNENIIDVMSGHLDNETGAILGDYNHTRLGCSLTPDFIKFLTRSSTSAEVNQENLVEKKIINFELFREVGGGAN